MSSWLVFNEDDLSPAIEMVAALAEQSRWGVRLLPPGEEPGWEGWREPLAHVFAQPGTPRANGFYGLGVWAMFRPWRTVDLGLPIPPEWQLLRDEGSRLRKVGHWDFGREGGDEPKVADFEETLLFGMEVLVALAAEMPPADGWYMKPVDLKSIPR